jgi:hypothetical protein
MDFALTPAAVLMETVTKVVSNAPVLGNGAICADSLCTTGRAAVNFYCSPNPISRVFFGASCVLGVAGAVSSGTALATSALGVPAIGVVGSFGARGLNRLGKYTLHMGNVTSGNITNASSIAELMN